MTQRIQDVGMSILEGRVDLTLWSEEGRPDPEAVMRDLPYADGLIMTMGIAMVLCRLRQRGHKGSDRIWRDGDKYPRSTYGRDG